MWGREKREEERWGGWERGREKREKREEEEMEIGEDEEEWGDRMVRKEMEYLVRGEGETEEREESMKERRGR